MKFTLHENRPWYTGYLSILLAWALGLAAGHALRGSVGAAVVAAPAALGVRLRALSLSGGGGNAAAWAAVVAISALPLLGLLTRRRQKADLLLPLACVTLGVGLFFLVNPTLLGAYLSTAEMWGLCVLGTVGSILVSWAILRLMAKLEQKPAKLLPEILYWGAGIYAFLLGADTVQTVAAKIAAVEAGNTALPQLAASTANTIETLAAWRSIPGLMTAALVLWGSELLRAMESDPFAEETVALAEKVMRRCRWVVGISLFVAVSCNLMQLARFNKLASIDASVYFPFSTLALAAVLQQLCRYFRRAKAVSDDNDTII